MVGLMDNGVAKQPHIGVRYGHALVRLKDQSYEILVRYMCQCAEPDKRHQNLSMIVDLRGKIKSGLHDEDAMPYPVLLLGGLVGTRLNAVLSLVIVTGVFKQRMLDASECDLPIEKTWSVTRHKWSPQERNIPGALACYTLDFSRPRGSTRAGSSDLQCPYGLRIDPKAR